MISRVSKYSGSKKNTRELTQKYTELRDICFIHVKRAFKRIFEPRIKLIDPLNCLESALDKDTILSKEKSRKLI